VVKILGIGRKYDVRPRGSGIRSCTRVDAHLSAALIKRLQCRVVPIGRRAGRQWSRKRGLSCRGRMEEGIGQRGEGVVKVHEVCLTML